MLKTALVVLMLSFGAFSMTVAERVTQEEVQNNVRCDLERERVGICLNFYCVRSFVYSCSGAEDTYRIRIRARYYSLMNGSESEMVTSTRRL